MLKETQKIIVITYEQLEELSDKLLNKHIQSLKKSAHEFDDDVLFTIDEACEFMRITRSTLHKWGKEGTIPQVRKGGRVFYKKSDIMEKRKVIV